MVLAIVALGGGSGGGGKPAPKFEPFTKAAAFRVDVPAGLDPIHTESEDPGDVIHTELQSPGDTQNVQIVQDLNNAPPMERAENGPDKPHK